MADATARGYVYLLFLRVFVPAVVDLVLGLILVSLAFFASAGLALVSTSGVAIVGIHGQPAALALGVLYALAVLVMAIRRHLIFSRATVPHAARSSHTVPDPTEDSHSD